MRPLIAIAFAAALAAPAPTSNLDDCTLPAELHDPDTDAPVPDACAWMLHDLAVSRRALQQRSPSRAARLATELDRVVVARVTSGAYLQERPFLEDLHDALGEVLVDAGWAAPAPLPAAPVEDDELLSLR